MENSDIWQIILACILLPGMAYLLMQSIQQGKAIASLHSTVDLLNRKMDLFLKTEIDTLKDIAKSVSNNGK